MDAWNALTRRKVRSFLTMAGIVWGIIAVTLLIAYGSGFRAVLVHGFDAFGKSAVICWPGQTSEQAGGQRAGKKVRFEQADLDNGLSKKTPEARRGWACGFTNEPRCSPSCQSCPEDC